MSPPKRGQVLRVGGEGINRHTQDKKEELH
ncbi:uncharacterized protein METZ01_LOCUS277560, partial [marine metagenome]